MKLAVIYNQQSGGGFDKKNLGKLFDKNKIVVEQWIPINAQLEKTLRTYVAKHPKATVAVVGGDGSMNGATKILGGTAATLAPLPGGTLNHFARDLGVPVDIEQAIAQLPTNKVKKIDYGSINDIVFCNNAGLGIYPRSLVEREEHESRIGKWPAAVWGAMVALVRFRSYKLLIDGRTVRTPFVFIGNNRYEFSGGNVSRARLDGGILCIYVALAHNRLQLLAALLAALIGKTYRLRSYEGVSFRIDGKVGTLPVSHDGELTQLTLPLDIQLERKKLNVLV